jgi:lipooligosaccharide transport system ATP-binding protein
MWDRLKRLLARGKTILLTSHFMEEAERLCTRLVVMDHGRFVNGTRILIHLDSGSAIEF